MTHIFVLSLFIFRSAIPLERVQELDNCLTNPCEGFAATQNIDKFMNMYQYTACPVLKNLCKGSFWNGSLWNACGMQGAAQLFSSV